MTHVTGTDTTCYIDGHSHTACLL